MPEHPASLLAVVQLVETGAYAWELRLDPTRPLAGYCLAEGNAETVRMSAYVENLRPPGPAGPALHAWSLTAETAVSLGPLADPEVGDRTATYAFEAQADHLSGGTGVWITAGLTGPMGLPILEGTLVWLRSAGPRESTVEAAPESVADAPPDDQQSAGAGPFEDAELPAPDEVDADGEAVLAHLTAETLTPEPPAPTSTSPEPPDTAEALSDPVVETVPETASIPVPTTTAEAPIIPVAFRIPLASQHPLAPRAGGTATLSPATGSLQVVLRALPNAAALGHDPQTGHAYSGYRAWLVTQRTRARVCAGLCTRLWGGNYRLQVDAGLPLRDYDAILITAVDRNATVVGPDAPRVLLGPYKVSG